jgi:hypothetical protein
VDEADNYNWLPRAAHIIQVLLRTEPQLRITSPDLAVAVAQTREKLLITLPLETQKQLPSPDQFGPSGSVATRTFAEQIEIAEKDVNVNERDDLIVGAVLGSSAAEGFDRVLGVLDKISDTDLRSALTEWCYFTRAKRAVDSKQFAEAERLTARVEGRELRAYLKIEIAKALLSNNAASVRGREVLDEGIAEANKSGMTIYAARALLTAADLYSRIEPGRSLAVLGEAINCVNHVEAPDFSADDQSLVKRVKRKSNAGRFIFTFHMPGLDPERAFRELAKIEFDVAFSQTSALNDKFLRAMTTLAIANVCLERTLRPAKEKSRNTAKSQAGP